MSELILCRINNNQDCLQNVNPFSLQGILQALSQSVTLQVLVIARSFEALSGNVFH